MCIKKSLLCTLIVFVSIILSMFIVQEDGEDVDYSHVIEIGDNFEFVQLEGIDDRRLQESINNLLFSIPKDIYNHSTANWLQACKVEVTGFTKDYISILYSTQTSKEGDIKEEIRFGITVDIKKAERLFLNDIIELNDNFVQTLMNYDYKNEFSPPITENVISRLFIQASTSEVDYLREIKNDDPYAYDFSASYIRRKATFFLTEDNLIIIRDEYDLDDIILPLPRW